MQLPRSILPLLLSAGAGCTVAAVQAANGNATTHRVQVGDGQKLVFNPSTVFAKPSDTVEFLFHPLNHSVVQSTIEAPCAPRAGGFYSGFIPSSAGEAPTSFVLTINDTNPIYFYCSEGSHCQLGMVGIINPGNNVSQYNLVSAAAQAQDNVSPVNGPSGGVFGSSPSSSPNGTTVPGNSTPPSSSSAAASSSSATGSGVVAGSPTASGSGSGTATGAAASSTSSGAAVATGMSVAGVVGAAAMAVGMLAGL